jgi:hypothetical protein
MLPCILVSLMYICPAQVTPQGPTQDIVPLTMMQDGIYVSGELWEYWRDTFPHPSVRDMFNFVVHDIDDERAEFVRSLAPRGPCLPV